MSHPLEQPLNGQVIEKIRQALDLLNLADTVNRKARNCGIDCRAEEASVTYWRDRLSAIMHEFGGQR